MTFPFRFGRQSPEPARLGGVTRHFLAGITPAPQVLDRSGVEFSPVNWRNDELPDCTSEALFNVARATAAISGWDLYVDPAAPPNFYAACVGNPPDLSLTGGAVMLDVLEKADSIGLDTGHDILFPVARTIPHDRATICKYLELSKTALYLGVNLYDSDEAAFVAGTPWKAQPPGQVSTGGHALFAWDYTKTHIRLGTWGKFVLVEWERFDQIVEEAHTVIFPQITAQAWSTL